MRWRSGWRSPHWVQAGSANASCASLNGHNIGGHGCTSTPGSVSVGLGRDAQATSLGTGNVAVAVGNPGKSLFYRSDHPTLAYAEGTGNVSVALGDGSLAGTKGNGNRAFVLGQGSNAFSFGGDIASPFGSNHNTSVTIGDLSDARAVGPHHKLSTAFGNNKQLQNNGLNQAPPG